MAFKSILTYLDASPALVERIKLAADLTKRHNAHLIGLAPTGIATIPGGEYLSVTTDLVDELQQRLDNIAQSAINQFEELCGQMDIDSNESRLVGNVPIDTVLLHARYSDLVVIGQADEVDEPGTATAGFVEQVVLAAGRPVIVVPNAGQVKSIGKTVLLAWDASREAARAISDAMPILQEADAVEVVVVNADKNKPAHGPAPGTDIALYLARHNVNVVVRNLPSTIDIGNTLLSHAADMGADMIVMGAYGHSRVREWVMGGTTRTILGSMTVPVFMTH